ncbi:MAG TPA: hypothetical protein VFB13_05080 [Reyranella sp.]|nr:hypothetical protein [Reyranella sp.]
MTKIRSFHALEELGRVQLSPNFFVRDFLHSEIASFHGLLNVPDDPAIAIAAGRRLCVELLEPLQRKFGRLAIRSGYRSPAVNALGNRLRLGCGSNEANRAAHIWDQRDRAGSMGAMACIVIPSFLSHYKATGDWKSLALWIHDHLPYSKMTFYPRNMALNLGWKELRERTIYSYIRPHVGYLARP